MAHFEEPDPFYVKALDEQRELDRLVSGVEHKPHNSIEPRKVYGPRLDRAAAVIQSVAHSLGGAFPRGGSTRPAGRGVCRLPRLASQATALERRDEPLLQQRRPIVERAQECGSSPDRWESVAREFRRFVHTSIVHEGAESRLAEEAFKGGRDSLECGNDAHCANPLTPVPACGEEAAEHDANSPQNMARGSIGGDRRTPASNLQLKKEDELRCGGGGNEHSGM
jgi:hypothetical protein